MTKISKLHKKWSKDEQYNEAYEKIAEEFERSAAIFSESDFIGQIQEDLAEKNEGQIIID